MNLMTFLSILSTSFALPVMLFFLRAMVVEGGAVLALKVSAASAVAAVDVVLSAALNVVLAVAVEDAEADESCRSVLVVILSSLCCGIPERTLLLA